MVKSVGNITKALDNVPQPHSEVTKSLNTTVKEKDSLYTFSELDSKYLSESRSSRFKLNLDKLETK